jgi:23S rRNA (guanosine2251-2'-O)-methyltransferase
MNKFPLRLILDDLRSAGNVGSILRTADACNVELIYACGYTPYPEVADDSRPPHVSSSNQRNIAKTALGAEIHVPVLHFSHTLEAINQARSEGFKIIVIEQTEKALKLYQYKVPSGPIALVMGNEVDGVSEAHLALADDVVELPMLGTKESLNVAVAAAIAMYHFRFIA